MAVQLLHQILYLSSLRNLCVVYSAGYVLLLQNKLEKEREVLLKTLRKLMMKSLKQMLSSDAE